LVSAAVSTRVYAAGHRRYPSGANLAYFDYDYNAFITGANTFSPQGSHNVTASAFGWLPGPLGNFYLPTGSALQDSGSRSAAAAGLFHFTTSSAQQKEGLSTVDRGYHYVALDANGVASDVDGDSTPDYLADANGNGAVDANEAVAWFNTQGQWNQVYSGGSLLNLGIGAVHGHLVPSGKVFLYEEGTLLRIFDPAQNSAVGTTQPGFNVFCNGHCLMPDGTVIVAGGTLVENFTGSRSLAVYSPRDDFWTRLPPMNNGRWYASCTTLASGEILVTSGTYVTTTDGSLGDTIHVADVPQAWDPATGQFRDLSGASEDLQPFPFIFTDPTVSPPGIFFAGPDHGPHDSRQSLLTTARLSTVGTGGGHKWAP
jgi:hypothetical protein